MSALRRWLAGFGPSTDELRRRAASHERRALFLSEYALAIRGTGRLSTMAAITWEALSAQWTANKLRRQIARRGR